MRWPPLDEIADLHHHLCDLEAMHHDAQRDVERKLHDLGAITAEVQSARLALQAAVQDAIAMADDAQIAGYIRATYEV